MTSEDSRVRIGRVVKPHGIAGELVVEPVGESLAGLDAGAHVRFGREPDTREIESLRPHAGRWLVAVEGVVDRDGAERLRGCWLTVPADRLPQLEGDEVYVDDLIGCQLTTIDGDPVGEVVGVRSGAQDLLEVEAPDGLLLVPMAADWLVDLDVAARRIRMRLPEGLLTIPTTGSRPD